jgi:AraC-like DNA-binding protein
MRYWILSLFGLFVWFSVISCSREGRGDSYERDIETNEDLLLALELLSESPDDLDLNRKVWSYYTKTGRFDTLIIHAEPVFNRSFGVPGKDRLSFTSGAFILQAHVFRENFDSVPYYLNRIMPLVGSKYGSDVLDAIAHNSAAIYYLKTELNYSAALEHYEAALAIMESKGDIVNQSALLCNIADIYVSLRDPAGFKYALAAYGMVRSDNTERRSSERMVLSAILLAQMYYLKGDFTNALRYADEISDEVSEFRQHVSSLDLLYADIAVGRNDYRKAERHYRLALAHADDAQPSVNALIYMRYGAMLSRLSRYAEATEMFHRGLETRALEYRNDLLLALSDVAVRQGRDREALDYYKEYHAWLDSVSYNRERAFQQYRLLVKDNELQSREVDLLKANRRIIIIVAGLALILLVAVALWVTNRRQNRMYRLLVEAHQQSLARLNAMRGLSGGEDESDTREKDDYDLQLWHRLEEVMASEQIYRYGDISLDKMAEILGTNRAYVSRAINKYSHMSFYHYIHSRRIEDASRILSDTSKDIPLKTLALDLGYNSISSFYRAFVKETGVPPSRYREELLKIKG